MKNNEKYNLLVHHGGAKYFNTLKLNVSLSCLNLFLCFMYFPSGQTRNKKLKGMSGAQQICKEIKRRIKVAFNTYLLFVLIYSAYCSNTMKCQSNRSPL